MSIELKCQCGKRYRVPSSAASKTVRCPHCKAVLRAPAGGDESTRVTAPPPPAAAGNHDGQAGAAAEAPRAPKRLGAVELDPNELTAAKAAKAAKAAAGKSGEYPCPNCGATLTKTDMTCKACGLDLREGVIRKKKKAEEEEEALKAPTKSSELVERLAGKKRWILFGVLALSGIGMIWFGFLRIAHPTAGPFDIEFRQRGGQLEMSILWECPGCLPEDPKESGEFREETNRQVSRWSVILPDGTKVKPTWTDDEISHAVNVNFEVPRSTRITVRLDPSHEGHLTTPAMPERCECTLKWNE